MRFPKGGCPIPTDYWTKGAGRQLRRAKQPEASILALYLMSSPHSTPAPGVYTLSFDDAAFETGLPLAEMPRLFGVLDDIDFAEYDELHDLVWVRDLAIYRIGDTLSPKDNRHVQVLREAKSFQHSFLYEHWFDYYREPFNLDVPSVLWRAPSVIGPSYVMGETWTDHRGVTRPVPSTLARLKFTRPGHAALRAFVMQRDGFRCMECGVEGSNIPENYDGRNAIDVSGPKRCLVVDHVLARMNGGVHHPRNLQVLCEECNARKAGNEDAHVRVVTQVLS